MRMHRIGRKFLLNYIRKRSRQDKLYNLVTTHCMRRRVPKMKNVSLLFIIHVSVLLVNCTSMQPIHQGATMASGVQQDNLITQSLFDEKNRTISEEDIQRLLNGRIKIRDTVRVALFKFSGTSINRYYTNWWTDEEYLKTQQSFVDTLTSQIGESPKVKNVFPVPSLMTNPSPNMTQLRETAVRLQADILIVYAISSDIYYKYRMFHKNQAKAFATCETILMDTRTGVIPHSSVITKERLVLKDQEELTDTETRKKAEREAIALTLIDTGRAISDFLNNNNN